MRPSIASSGAFAGEELPLAFIADSMLSYKLNYADGLLGHWPPSELAAFLLDWWPRKVIADRATEQAAPAAVLSFLGFLEGRDSLSGGSLEELSDVLAELAEPFLDACEDVASWGIGKSLLARDGLEPGRTHTAARQPRADQRRRRKAARAARKRNRR
jgi:hypothetical protein